MAPVLRAMRARPARAWTVSQLAAVAAVSRSTLAARFKQVVEQGPLEYLSALSACESADFLYLQRVTGLSKGNLSSHLAKLEKGGIVIIDKTAERRPRTVVSLTEPGRTTVAEHWERLIRLHEAARTWVPSED